MIELEALSYTYPEAVEEAVRSVSMHVVAGETILLVGRSGSGKSTILRVMNGLVPHFFGGRFQGHATIAGMNTRTASPAELSGKVGTVFQEPGYRFLSDNLIDEIAFGMELVGIPGAEIRSRVESIVDRFELGPFAERSLDRMSAGEQQRVSVAAALSRRPEILLLDEPTSQLDTVSAGAILDWVKELQAQYGLTLVVAEHRLDRLIDRVDRIAYLSLSGELEKLGPPEIVLRALPFSTPLAEAAKLCGLDQDLEPNTLSVLRERILGRGSETNLSSAGKGEVRLEAQGLTFNYNGIPALERVDLRVNAGEIVALLGRNGAGKSTLLRCLIGLLQAGSGEIKLDGEVVNGQPVSTLARKIAYVPQWPSALLFAETVQEELSFTLRNHKLDQDPPICPRSLLERFGLSEVADHYPRDLSAGQRQRVALASVLVTKPGVILLDEPTLGMDPIAIEDLGDLLQAWKEEGAGIVIATHNIEFAAAIADQAVILDRGRVISSGPISQTLFSQSAMRTALQRLTGCAHPASIHQIKAFVEEKGAEHADH
jgi:energy-coupling factor transporter ATP-binding protein EcfA2